MEGVDDYDIKIMNILQQDGRISNVKLAKQLSLSEAPCWRRLQRLKESGIIKGYQAVLDRRKLGFGILSFIQIKFIQHDEELTNVFEMTINDCPEVMSCHNISGEADFLLIVVARNLDEYADFIDQNLRKIPGITDITSNFSLREMKSSFKLPLE